jgi:putative FmdB family regulatory protein
MPLYGFRCGCGRTDEHYFPLRDSHPLAKCGECGKEMERDLTVEASNHIPGSAFPYITKNITGSPIEVRSEAHLQQLCKEHNVTHRDDTAWIEKSYEGIDFRTGKHIYHEGSGLGVPGCWI